MTTETLVAEKPPRHKHPLHQRENALHNTLAPDLSIAVISFPKNEATADISSKSNHATVSTEPSSFIESERQISLKSDKEIDLFLSYYARRLALANIHWVRNDLEDPHSSVRLKAESKVSWGVDDKGTFASVNITSDESGRELTQKVIFREKQLKDRTIIAFDSIDCKSRFFFTSRAIIDGTVKLLNIREKLDPNFKWDSRRERVFLPNDLVKDY